MNESRRRLRIDKWLWAARFYKTRGLAKRAIEAGHVECDGERIKPAKEISVGQQLAIRRGDVRMEVRVEGLSEQRRGATEAQQLYTETEESIARREQVAAERRLVRARREGPATRPTKRDRRALDRLRIGDDP